MGKQSLNPVLWLFVLNLLCVHSLTLTARVKKAQPKLITEKPAFDSRLYQTTVLDNGVQVVNVIDSRSPQAAMAVSVGAGSYDDPDKLLGLAHFCEHMVFLGTKDYPQPDGFDAFMAANGGYDNAWTASEDTVYYGELSSAAADEGLDRLADFIRAPLFDPKYVKREVHAIDSEHSKNIEDPDDRIWETMYSLASPDSPVSRFSTGNYDTLYKDPMDQGINTVDELRRYFEEKYCATNIRVVTYGPKSLETQLDMAQRAFGNLTRTSPNCRSSHALPEAWPADRLGKFVEIENTQPYSELWMQFVYDGDLTTYDSQPLQYLYYVMTYGGEDSLTEFLQQRLGLTTYLDVGWDTTSAGTSVFIWAGLTKRGSSNLDLVMNSIYAYIATLRSSGVDSALYKSLVDVFKLDWDWGEAQGPSDTAADLAERFLAIPAEKLLSSGRVIEKINGDDVAAVINGLVPSKMNVGFVKPKSKESQHELVLPFYGVRYSVTELAEAWPAASELWERWLKDGVRVDEVNEDLKEALAPLEVDLQGSWSPRPPKQVQNVPKDFDLSYMAPQASHGTEAQLSVFGPEPERVELSAHAASLFGASQGVPEVWYRRGWVSNSPKVQMKLALRQLYAPGAADPLPLEAVQLELYSRMLSSSLEPKMFDMEILGMEYSFDASPTAMVLGFGGFSTTIPALIGKFADEFAAFNSGASSVTDAQYERIRNTYNDELSSYSAMPSDYALSDLRLLLTQGAFAQTELLGALETGMSKDSCLSSVSQWLTARPVHVSAIAMGNWAEGDARQNIGDAVGNLLPLASNEAYGELQLTPQVVKVAQPVEVRKVNPRAGDPNDVVVVAVVAGIATVESRVILGILGDLIGQVAYTELRTERQLGYVVNARTSTLSNVQYISCTVQGTKLDADAAEAAIESVFAKSIPEQLELLSDEDFESYRAAFRANIVMPPTDSGEELSHFWNAIERGGQCFDMANEMISFIDESLTCKDALLQEWSRLMNPENGVREKIVVKYFSGRVPPIPSHGEATKLWKEQGVPNDAIPLLQRERDATMILDSATSISRASLLEKGSYYEATNICRRAAASSTALSRSVAHFPVSENSTVIKRTTLRAHEHRPRRAAHPKACRRLSMSAHCHSGISAAKKHSAFRKVSDRSSAE